MSDLCVCVVVAGPASASRGSYWPMKQALPAFREVNVNGKVMEVTLRLTSWRDPWWISVVQVWFQPSQTCPVIHESWQLATLNTLIGEHSGAGFSDVKLCRPYTCMGAVCRVTKSRYLGDSVSAEP